MERVKQATAKIATPGSRLHAQPASDGNYYGPHGFGPNGRGPKVAPVGEAKVAASKPGAEVATYKGATKDVVVVSRTMKVDQEGGLTRPSETFAVTEKRVFVQEGSKVTEISGAEFNKMMGGKKLEGAEAAKAEESIKARHGFNIETVQPHVVGAPLNSSRAFHLDEILRGDIRVRAFAVDDLEVKGRTVTAYAAVFDTPASVVDKDGEYEEVLDRRSFSRTIEHHRRNDFAGLNVYYNHALTLYGTPSERFAVPIGRAIDVKEDRRGVLTTALYNDGDHASEVLASIRNGEVTGQSFTGRFVQSEPSRSRFGAKWNRRSDGSLTRVRRLEVAMKEFGPTPAPVYKDARILGVRSIFDRLPEDERRRALDYLGIHGTPEEGLAVGGDSQSHSSLRAEAVRLRAQLRSRGIV
jgi:HK97 family phage prohead protease